MEKVAALMTADACIQEGREKPLTRARWLKHEREEQREDKKRGAANTGLKMQFDVVQVAAHGERATLRSRFYASLLRTPKEGAKAQKMQASGYLNATLRRENGVWKWYRLKMVPTQNRDNSDSCRHSLPRLRPSP